MAEHNGNFRREDCIWLNEKDDIVGRLERIETATSQIPVLLIGINRVNGTLARHDNELVVQGKVLEVLKDHDGRGVSLRQAVLTAVLALVGGAMLLVIKTLL